MVASWFIKHLHVYGVHMFVFFPFHPYVIEGKIILSKLKSALLFVHLFVAICILNHTVRLVSFHQFITLFHKTLCTGTKLFKTNSDENIISPFILQSLLTWVWRYMM